ncbi:hypothetical protein HYU17_02865 [Candidatus Woesearchaeota archaeon]|nr:hypothetical protein [Candidatus Woesearchaeota archaeon]
MVIMVSKAVKVSEENYNWLCEIAGTAQAEEKRVVSIDEAITKVRKRLSGGKLSDLAGAWKTMSEKEAKDFMRDLRAGWKKWTKSA